MNIHRVKLPRSAHPYSENPGYAQSPIRTNRSRPANQCLVYRPRLLPVYFLCVVDRRQFWRAIQSPIIHLCSAHYGPLTENWVNVSCMSASAICAWLLYDTDWYM